jgi:hypothetical protein
MNSTQYSQEATIFHGIEAPEKGNIIQRITGVNAGTGFGDKINLLYLTDAHALPSLEQWNALQAALLDSEGSICLVDSNVDSNDGHVYKLQKTAETDSTVYCHYVNYKDLEDYKKHAPEWVSRPKAEKLQKTLLPQEFKRDILGLRSSGAANPALRSKVFISRASVKS